MRMMCHAPIGLPEKRWHTLRHTFGTHAALFGVNPWRLQSWMGHKRIDETMIYVHVAENHRREIPACVMEAGQAETDRTAGCLACSVPVAKAWQRRWGWKRKGLQKQPFRWWR